jgi:hypothetical protein
MAKLSLTTIGSRYGSIDALNANFDAIEAAFENTLSRDGALPNNLESNLDMDSNRIINLPVPVGDSDAATKAYVDAATSLLNGYVDEIAIVANNITDVVFVADNYATLTSIADDLNDVANNITEITGVADNIGSVELVGLDLNGAFQQGVVYDFGSIADPAVGEVEETTSSIVIVANNIDDVNTVATNIVDVQNAYTNATNSATSAAASATSADESAASAAAALVSEGNAATSESNAATSESNASTSASNASTSATNASNSATAASGYATTASDAKDDAVTAQLAAEAALASTLAAYDNFDDRYLGAKASDPSTDNDGDALVAGALYFQTGSGMKIWTGSTWEFAYVPGGTYLAKANNLSDLTNAATARTNLGLATVAATGAYTDLSGTPTLAAVATSGSYTDLINTPTFGALASLDEVGTAYITNNAVTVDKLAATLDYGSIV